MVRTERVKPSYILMLVFWCEFVPMVALRYAYIIDIFLGSHYRSCMITQFNLENHPWDDGDSIIILFGVTGPLDRSPYQDEIKVTSLFPIYYGDKALI